MLQDLFDFIIKKIKGVVTWTKNLLFVRKKDRKKSSYKNKRRRY